MSHWRRSPPERRLVVSVLCGVISLTVVGSAFGYEKTFDGVYTGKRSLTKGPTPLCPVEEDVSVTIHGDTLTFTNSALKKFTIGFNPDPEGSFGSMYTDIGGRTVFIQGHITGDVIEADVTNAPCEHHWRLTIEHQD